MQLFTSPEDLSLLKDRALEWEKNGFPKADPLMPMIIKKFNKFDNIAPIWSCEGHNAFTGKHDDGEIVNSPASNFYLITAVNIKGFATMMRIYEGLRNCLIEDVEKGADFNFITNLELVFITRHWPTGENRYYNCLSLRAYTQSLKAKNQFFSLLHDILDQALTLDADRIMREMMQKIK